MAKQLNKNVTVGVSAVFFVIITVLGVLMLYQMQQRDPALYLSKAREAQSQNQWERAAQFYYQAYRCGKDPLHLVYVGDALAQGQQDTRAIQQWRQATTIKPDLHEAWERILNLFLDYSHLSPNDQVTWQAIEREAGELLKQNPKNVVGLFARGRALIGLKDQKEGNAQAGLKDLEEAHKLAPDNVDYARALGVRYMQIGEQTSDLKRYEDAEAVFKAVVQSTNQPGEAASQARWVYGVFLATPQRAANGSILAPARFEEAEPYYEDALKLAGDVASVRAKALIEYGRFWIARYFNLRGPDDTPTPESEAAFNKAIQLLHESGETDPSSFEPATVLCGLYARARQTDKAIEVAERRLASSDIIRTGFKGREAKRDRVILLLSTAEQTITKAESLPGGSAERAEMIQRAQSHIDDALAEWPNNGLALHLSARLKLAENNSIEALKYAQQADEFLSPSYWLNKKLLALLLDSRRQSGAALKQIQAAIANPEADAGCWAVYTRLLLANDRADDAIRQADVALRRFGRQRDLLLVKLTAYQKLDKPELADAVRKELEIQAADSTTGTPVDMGLLNVATLQAAGRRQDALEACEKLLAERPADPQVVQRMVHLYFIEKRNDDALRVMRQAVASAPDPKPLQRLAELVDVLADPQVTDEQRSTRMLALFEQIEDPLDRAAQKSVWYTSKRQWAEALASLEEAERLRRERTASHAPGMVDALLHQIVDQKFSVALELNDERHRERLETIARQAAELNIDGAGGLTYRGRIQLALSEFDRAADSFRKALEQQRSNSRVHTLLGRAYLGQKRLGDAQASFEQAVELNPHEADAQLMLARLAADRGDEAEVARRLPICARLTPEDPWVKQRLLEQRELDAPDEAIARREGLRQQNPEDWQNVLRLAQLYEARDRQRGQTDGQADECYKAAYALDPLRPGIVYTWVSYLRRSNRGPEALSLLEQFVADGPSDEHKSIGQLMIGEHLQMYAAQSTGERAAILRSRAEAAFLEAAKRHQSVTVFANVARHYETLGNHAEAAGWYEKALGLAEAENLPQVRQVHHRLIDALVRADTLDAAEAQVANYLERYHDDAEGLLARAELEFRASKSDDAIRTVTAVLTSDPNNVRALLARSEYAMNRAEWPAAIADLEKVRVLAPDTHDFKPRIKLSTMYERSNRLDLATRELESILDTHASDPASFNVAVALLQLYNRSGRMGDALRVATSWINRSPTDARWYQARADLAEKAGDAGQAIADYREACRLSGNDPTMVARLLTLCHKLNRVDDGIRAYSEMKDDAQTMTVLTAYANLLARKGDTAGAVEQYRRAIGFGHEGDLTNATAVGLFAAREFGAARALELFSQPPSDPAQAASHPHLLASLYAAADDLPKAAAAYRALLETAPSDAVKAHVALRLASICAEQGDTDSARQYYELTTRLHPQDGSAWNNLAYLLVDSEPEKAVEYAQRAVQIRPDGAVLDTLGWALLKAGRVQEAAGKLSLALQASPNLATIYVHLAEARRRLGEFAVASELLRTALTLLAQDPDAATLRAQLDEVQRRVELKDITP